MKVSSRLARLAVLPAAAALCSLPFAGLVAPTDAREPLPPPRVSHDLRALGVERMRTAPCPSSRRVSRHARRIQNRISDARILSHLRRFLGEAYASGWFDHCDHGHLKIGVASRYEPDVARRVQRLERLLKLRGVDGITEVVAVRSNLHDLYAAQEAIDERLDSHFRLESSIDSPLNAVQLRADRTHGEQDRSVIEQVARDSPVDIRLSWVDPASLVVELLSG